MVDQAESLRKKVEQANKKKKNTDKEILGCDRNMVKIYAVVSGKGGVGKTNIAVNMAIAMGKMGKRVLLVDADIGMTNADILMGMRCENDLFDYIEGRVSIEDIIYEGPLGIKIISGGSGLLDIEQLTENKQKGFINELITLGGFDVMIIDNGAGISRETLRFITFAHEVILVTTPEPTSITDGYRVLKAISHYKLKDSVKIVVNKVSSVSIGKETFEKLEVTCGSFLKLRLENCGYVFSDLRMEKAIMEQSPVLVLHPKALSSINIEQIAGVVLGGEEFVRNISTLKQLGNRFITVFGSRKA